MELKCLLAENESFQVGQSICETGQGFSNWFLRVWSIAV